MFVAILFANCNKKERLQLPVTGRWSQIEAEARCLPDLLVVLSFFVIDVGLWTDNHHWARRRLQQCACGRAQQHATETTATVRANDDQLGALGGIGKRANWTVTSNDAGNLHVWVLVFKRLEAL